jgi:hypothetical protein
MRTYKSRSWRRGVVQRRSSGIVAAGVPAAVLASPLFIEECVRLDAVTEFAKTRTRFAPPSPVVTAIVHWPGFPRR